MDWLTNLPVIGPVALRLMRTHAWRAYKRLDEVHWAHLAAAISFSSFIALFPLLTVGTAVGAALLTGNQLKKIQDQLAEQVPGISDEIDIPGLAANAGTLGLIGGLLLLVIGINWVGTLRECLRLVWEKEESPGNWFLLKAKDAALLVGLGMVGLLAMGGSVLAGGAVGWVADRIGLQEGGAGRILLFLAGVVVSALADFLLLVYMLTRMPLVHPGRRPVVVAATIGAVGFELLKILLSGYLQRVAGKSVYGAFGVPIALMLWINFMARLLLYCAAWTATQHSGGPEKPVSPRAGGAPTPGGASGGAPEKPPHPVPGAPRR
jgi:membrane protein